MNEYQESAVTRLTLIAGEQSHKKIEECLHLGRWMSILHEQRGHWSLECETPFGQHSRKQPGGDRTFTHESHHGSDARTRNSCLEQRLRAVAHQAHAQ